MPSISLNGIDINYIDEGQGETLLLIHNLTSNIEGFSHNIPELAKHYRVIAPDLRGHGGTTHCESFDEASDFYTFANITEDVSQLLNALRIENFHLFGQAFWGVSTAFSLFNRYPERVKSLIVAATSMLPCDPGEKPYDKLGEIGKRNFLRMHELARNEGMMEVYNDRLSSGQFWSEKVLNTPSILAEFKEAHELTSAVAFVQIPHFSHALRAEVCNKLAKYQPRLMLLLGEQDSHNPASIREMRKDYPSTQVIILPDCGHYPTVENPYDFNCALLNFYNSADFSQNNAETA